LVIPAVEPQRLTDDRDVATEFTLPEAIAKDDAG
jgi:hypothetical protein